RPRHFLLGFLWHLNLGRANVFDFNRRGPVNVPVLPAEADGARNLVLQFGELAVFDPKLHRAFGISSLRGLATAAPSAKGEQRLRAVLGQVRGISVTILLEL